MTTILTIIVILIVIDKFDKMNRRFFELENKVDSLTKRIIIMNDRVNRSEVKKNFKIRV